MSKLQGSIRKAAILVSTLDRESADLLLEKMGSERSARVRNAIMQLGNVTPAERDTIVQEFMRAGVLKPHEQTPGIELDDSLAQKLAASPACYAESGAAGRHEAEVPPFRFLHEAAADSVARHLEREHPQVIAVVVAHLPPRNAADLITRLPARLQAEVLQRVAELDAADPEVIRDVERELKLLLSDEIRAAKTRSAGLAAVTSILNAAGGQRSELLANLNRHDRRLAAMLADTAQVAAVKPLPTAPRAAQIPGQSPTARGPEGEKTGHTSPPSTQAAADSGDPQAAAEPCSETMEAPPDAVEFAELAHLDDGGLAQLFGAADPQLALLALAGASRTLVDRIMKQLPTRHAKSLRRQLEQLGPMRLTDIEQAQRQLARLAAQLAARGQLRLPQSRRFAVAA